MPLDWLIDQLVDPDGVHYGLYCEYRELGLTHEDACAAADNRMDHIEAEFEREFFITQSYFLGFD